MYTIGVRDARTQLPTIIRRAETGERTVITAHGRPVAQIAPLDHTNPLLDHLIAAGAITAPRRRSPWRAPDSVRIWSGVRIDRALRELRG
jgi:prevent-host-death family protein